MRIKALVIRILQQFIHDKRTLGLMIVAPIIVLSMLYLVFNGRTYHPKLGLVNAPTSIVKQFKEEKADIQVLTQNKALNKLTQANLDAYIDFSHHVPVIHLEGSDPSINRAVLLLAKNVFQNLNSLSQSIDPKIMYLHGSKDMSSFDNFGPVLVGFFIFFFVFLIAGVSFLRERTGGTLERLLATPLRRWEIVLGYVGGFGVFTILQATIIVLYSVYILKLLMVGSIWYVLLITLLLSFSALTLGILLSAFANNELQMIQFIPLVIVPQIFFSGLFNLDTITQWLSWLSYITPLYYGTDALRNIMIRGQGWSYIVNDIYVLFIFSIVFIVLNIIALRKYRKI